MPAQSPTPTPPTPQVPPIPPIPQIPTGVTSVPDATPTAIYNGFREQRRELARQLETLEERREDLAEQLQDPMINATDKAGLEHRITEIDQRISALDQHIALADAQVASAAAIPGAVVQPKPVERSGPPEEVFVLSGMFIVAVLLPLTIAYSRRIWRRSAVAVAALPKEIAAHLSRLEQAIESVAIEVERIGEGQRFMTRAMTESGPRALGVGPAEPIEVKARDATPERRR